MSKDIFSWENYGLIAELAYRLKRLQFSKTALQKLIFLLQELFNINCGYRFDFYINGPYCSDIEIDLSLVESWGGINIYPGGYNISPGRNNKAVRGMITDHEKRNALDNLIKEFGGLSTKELGLISTIVYVAKIEKDISEEELLDIVKSFKPRTSEPEILDAIKTLQTQLKSNKKQNEEVFTCEKTETPSRTRRP